MPKNQFQRPLQVNHIRNVPRHGQNQKPSGKHGQKPDKALPEAALPPLASLFDKFERK